MPVFVNRLLDLKKIKLIGFDMDYTLVAYHTEFFEGLTHKLAKKRLVEKEGYPKAVKKLNFDYNRAIMGLVIDKLSGHLLKLNRFGKVKTAFHGLKKIDFREQAALYRDRVIDIREPEFVSLDTAFAISNGVLFAQLVQLKKEGVLLPDYFHLVDDIFRTIEELHKDGTLKAELRKDFPRYVLKDNNVVPMLERFKAYGKKLMIITNSDYIYSKDLLEYALDPHLVHHKSWQDLFDIVITFAEKPLFFQRQALFLSVDPVTGLLSNYTGSVTSGIYQGGWYGKLQNDLELSGNEILYLGDHIYGDVVSIKKLCDWRTALVLGGLGEEILAIKKALPVQKEIDQLMARITELEQKLYAEDLRRYEQRGSNEDQKGKYLADLESLNTQVSVLLDKLRRYFNPYWGEILRAGYEESRYADQLERYACIYMTRVSDLYSYSPRTYFRPSHHYLPHENLGDLEV